MRKRTKKDKERLRTLRADLGLLTIAVDDLDTLEAPVDDLRALNERMVRLQTQLEAIIPIEEKLQAFSPVAKRMWLRALLSEEYTQGQGRLCAQEVDEEGFLVGEPEYCCLGVLVDVAVEADWEVSKGMNVIVPFDAEWMVGGNGAEIPERYAEALGLTHHVQTTLAEMNDNGDSFKTIAKWIEKNL